MTRRLVVFAKPPLPGVAKTRLAVDLGTVPTAQVARAMLLDTIGLCERLWSAPSCTDSELVLAYTDEADWFASRLSSRWLLIQQRGDDLGQRLENALAEMDPSQEDATAFIGMDAPHLPVALLDGAFMQLSASRAVLGPCDDGGYYLVGVRGLWPAGVLSKVRWSTEHALADTREALAAAGLPCTDLAPWYDIDDLASLRRLAQQMPELPANTLPHVRRVLSLLNLSEP